jgi:hypothetical protein
MNHLKILGARKVTEHEIHTEDSQVLCALYKIESSRRLGSRDLFTPALLYNIISTCHYQCAFKSKVHELSRNFRRHLFAVLLTSPITYFYSFGNFI